MRVKVYKGKGSRNGFRRDAGCIARCVLADTIQSAARPGCFSVEAIRAAAPFPLKPLHKRRMLLKNSGVRFALDRLQANFRLPR